jgi:hypothetical protein
VSAEACHTVSVGIAYQLVSELCILHAKRLRLHTQSFNVVLTQEVLLITYFLGRIGLGINFVHLLYFAPNQSSRTQKTLRHRFRATRQHTTSRDAAEERKDNVSEKVQKRYHFHLLKLRYDALHYPWGLRCFN